MNKIEGQGSRSQNGWLPSQSPFFRHFRLAEPTSRRPSWQLYAMVEPTVSVVSVAISPDSVSLA